MGCTPGVGECVCVCVCVCVRVCAQVYLESRLLKVALVSHWRVLALVKLHFLNKDTDILRKVILLKRIYHISILDIRQEGQIKHLLSFQY